MPCIGHRIGSGEYHYPPVHPVSTYGWPARIPLIELYHVLLVRRKVNAIIYIRKIP
jgi:hypothetical protein